MRIFVAAIVGLVTAAAAQAQTIPHLPIPMGAGTAEVWNNEIYHFGGSDDWAGTTNYPRIYRFNGTTWSYHDSIPDDNVWDVESELVGDDVYLISGWPYGASLLRRYDLTSGAWQYLADSPNLDQTWGVAAEHLGGFIYLFLSDGNVYRYEITANTWTTRTPNSAYGSWDLSSILYQGEIYIIGWSQSAFYKYSPTADEWTQLADSPYQVGACAMGIINNLIYCVGGNRGGETGAYYRSIIRYDIDTGQWAVDSLEISSRRHWMATAEYLGGLYVLGGLDSLSYAVDIVEEIVPQGTAGVTETGVAIPRGFALEQNYPNPFNPLTTIRYSLPDARHVTLQVFDIRGRRVSTLVDEPQPAGVHTVAFNASPFGSGVYFYRIEVGELISTKKMILVK